MPGVSCPITYCAYVTPDDATPELIIILLQLHSKEHDTEGQPGAKPEKVKQPVIALGGTSEDWSYFISRWNDYKAATQITSADVVIQLLECCEETLRKDLTLTNGGTLTGKAEEDVLNGIRRLAVRDENVMVSRMQLHNMRQERDEPLCSFASRLRWQAGVCKFTIKCPGCNQDVNYSDHMLRDAITRGISDQEIHLELLGEQKQGMSLEDTIHYIEVKEGGKRSANRHVDAIASTSATSSHTSQKKSVSSKMAQTSEFPPLGGGGVTPEQPAAQRGQAQGGGYQDKRKRNRVQGGWAASGGPTNRGRGSTRGQGSRGQASRGRPQFEESRPKQNNKPHPNAYGQWKEATASAWGNKSGHDNTNLESDDSMNRAIGQPGGIGHHFTFDDSSYVPVERKKKPIVEIELKPEDINYKVLSTEPSGESVIQMWNEFISSEEAKEMYEQLAGQIHWRRRVISKPSGGTYDEPRKTFWFGEIPYSYSRVTMESCNEWNPLVQRLKEMIEAITGHTYNSVLCNFYENGKDGVQWHSDDEFSLGENPVIASLSLGTTRQFQIRKKPNPPFVRDSDDFDQCEKYVINLTSGSLLVMKGCMQADWQHRVPKEYHDRDGRINLTFRTIHGPEDAD